MVIWCLVRNRCEVNFPDDLFAVFSPLNTNEKVFRKASKRYTSLLQSNLLAVHTHSTLHTHTQTDRPSETLFNVNGNFLSLLPLVVYSFFLKHDFPSSPSAIRFSCDYYISKLYRETDDDEDAPWLEPETKW